MSTQYYINRNDKVRGPFSEERLRELHAEGKLRESDFLSTRNDGGWKPAMSVLNQRSPARAKKPGATAPAPAGSNRSRTPLFIGVACFVVAAAGLGSWLAFSPREQPQSDPTSTPVLAQGVPDETNIPQPTTPVNLKVAVEFGGITGVNISWVSDGLLHRKQCVIPGTVEFDSNTRIQLNIDSIDLAGMEGNSLFPMLEIRELSQDVRNGSVNPHLKLELTADDFAAVLSGDLVTKVWYTPKDSSAVVEMLSSVTSTDGIAPESIAAQKGIILAIFRMGNRSRSFDLPTQPSPGVAASPKVTAIPSNAIQVVDTIQCKFTGLDSMAIGWVKNNQELRNQRFVPGRADFPCGGTTQLILDNIPLDGWKGKSLYPTLEINTADPRAADFLENVTVPLEITTQDVEKVGTGGNIRRVLYLESPASVGTSIPIAMSRLQTLDLDEVIESIPLDIKTSTIVAVLSINSTEPANPAATGRQTEGIGSSPASPMNNPDAAKTPVLPEQHSPVVDPALMEFLRKHQIPVRADIVAEAQQAQKQIETAKTGHVVFGQVQVPRGTSFKDVICQAELSADGYFVEAVHRNDDQPGRDGDYSRRARSPAWLFQRPVGVKWEPRL